MNENELIDRNLKLLCQSNTGFYRTDFVDHENRKVAGIRSERFANKLLTLKLITLNGYRCEPTEFGLEVYNNGGWLEYLKSKELSKVEIIKEKTSTEYNKKIEAQRWWVTTFIAILAIIIPLFFTKCCESDKNTKQGKDRDKEAHISQKSSRSTDEKKV